MPLAESRKTVENAGVPSLYAILAPKRKAEMKGGVVR